MTKNTIGLLALMTILTSCGGDGATQNTNNDIQKVEEINDDSGDNDDRHLDEGENSSFGFSEPESKHFSSGNLGTWATYYYLAKVSTVSASEGYALRDLNGNALGPYLSREDWCTAALEGSVYVKDDDTTYNYAGTASSNSVDCGSYYNYNTSRTKFRVANGHYGDGVRGYKLVPFRTIAVDPDVIPYGSVVYIPSAKGRVITLSSGEQVVHDGYFFAGDTGGAIEDNHIDVYLGPTAKNPFDFITSSEKGTFSAYIVSDHEVNDYLTNIH